MKTFCCCLPVRLGTFVLSALGLLGNGLLCFGLVFQMHRLHNPPHVVWIPAIVFGVVSGLAALFNLFGLIGSVMASRRLVSLYAGWLILAILVNAAIGIAYLIVLFTNQHHIKADCLNELTGVSNADSICEDLASTNKWIFLACFAVQALVQLYLLTIVRHYKQQLEESGHHYGGRNMAPSLLGNQGASGYGGGKDATPLHPYKPLGDADAQRSSAHLVPEKERDLERGSFDDGRSSPYRAEYRDAYDDHK